MTRALFDQILKGGWEGLLALRGTPEGPHLEAKVKADRATPKVDDGDRARIAKAICGLANADGGVFLFGVRAKKKGDDVDRIENIEAIADIASCLRSVEQAISSAVEPPISIVNLDKVTEPGTTAGIVVVYVAPSDGGPHRDDSGRYYLRAGSNTELMPHTVLADRFGRRPHPKLRLALEYRAGGLVLVYLRNEGRGAARQAAIVVRQFPSEFNAFNPGTQVSAGWSVVTAKDAIGWRAESDVAVYPGVDSLVVKVSIRGQPHSIQLRGALYAVDAPAVDFDGVVGIGDEFTII